MDSLSSHPATTRTFPDESPGSDELFRWVCLTVARGNLDFELHTAGWDYAHSRSAYAPGTDVQTGQTRVRGRATARPLHVAAKR